MRKLTLALSISFCSILSAFDSTIPVLHLPDYLNEKTRDRFLSDLEKAAAEVGFFALTGTGVDPELLNNSYEQMAVYFNQTMEVKTSLKESNAQRGYVLGESAKGENRTDYKEFFHVGRELDPNDQERLGYARNVWPNAPSDFRPVLTDLFQALDRCSQALGSAIGEVLNQHQNYINDMTIEGDCLMRAIHYLPNSPENAVWAAAHTDIDFLTILPRSTAKGLQVLNKEGDWVDVVVPDGAFIINCGDMLENLTNGYFKSSFHRVVDPGEGQDRYSVVFFVHPRSSDRLDPLPAFIEKTGGIRKYANVNRIELLAERLIDLGLASPALVELFVQSGAIERLKEVNRFSPKAQEALVNMGLY